MKLVQAVRLAFSAVRGNKMRSLLTMLGVIIGVFSVVALVSIGQGATTQVTEQVEAMGSNLITLNIRGRGAVRGLSYEEAIGLGERQGVGAIAPVLSQQVSVKYGKSSASTTLEGTTLDYQQVRNHFIGAGRFLAAGDINFRQRVAVLGTEVVNELFEGTNPLGKEISINGNVFTVVGIMEQKGSSMGGSNDNKIIIPLTTAQRVFQNNDIQTIYIQAESPELVDLAMSGLETFLNRHFRDDNAYSIFNQADMLDTMSSITGTLTLMLGGIGGISLLVGGIGIMNIMLVSVTERTREIGISKAIGAKRRDILVQFMVESIIISVTGGLLGLGLGIGVTRVIGQLFGISTSLSPEVIVIAIGFSLAVGIFFGMYPANKAAKLHPIEALRAQ